MANGTQHIPVFVASTFTDLKVYRDATEDALHRLQLIVHGMKFFGSNPNSPLDVCLAEVRDCKLFIGIFGMRYGHIPDGYDRSMTHLEYDEAQKAKLPSLIYIIDEDQPIPSKYVETGPGANKLTELKAIIRKKHMVSLPFTTPEDLAFKILHDVSRELRSIGTKVDERSLDATTSAATLGDYFAMPKHYVGREAVVDFVAGPDFSAATDACCEALQLGLGETVSASVDLSDGNTWLLLGERDIGERLRKVPGGDVVTVRGIVSYGEVTDAELLKLGIEKKRPISGLVIRNILRHGPQRSVSLPKRSKNWRWEK